MKMSVQSIFLLGLFLSGILYAPIAMAAVRSVTFWERGVGADFSGTVAIINDLPTHVDDLATCHTVVSETGIAFAYQSPLDVDATKRYVWIYTTSDTTPPVTTQSGIVPPDVIGNVFGYYKTQYMVTFASDPANAGSSGDQWLDEGTVPISATQNSGFVFDSWSSTGSLTIDNTRSRNTNVQVSGPGTITAHYISTTRYVLTASSSGHGSVTPSGVMTVLEGVSQTFVFTPDRYYAVSEILLNGTPMPLAAHITLTNIQKDHVLSVSFSEDVSQFSAVTFDSTPQGSGFVVVDGTAITTPHTFSWMPESVHTIEAAQTVSGGDGVKHNFDSWSNGGSIAQNYTVTNTTQTVVASYKTQYQLRVKTNFGTVSPLSGGWYDAGAKVSVKADAPSVVDGESYVFGGWKGTVGAYTGGNNPSDEFVMNGPVTEETIWQHIYELKVESPYGETFGAGWYEVDQVVHASINKSVEVVDTNEQIIFTGWGGDATGTDMTSSNIIMSGPKKAVALWTSQYRVVFTQSGLEAGVFGVGKDAVLDIGGSNLTLNDLPYRTDWINDGTTLNYQFTDSVTTSLGMVYSLGDLGQLASPLTVKSAATIQGTYSYKSIVFSTLNMGLLLLLLLIIALIVFLVMRRNKKK
jgi:hypothetical protein